MNEKGCTVCDPDEYPAEKWRVRPETACYIRRPDYSNYRFENNDIYLSGTEERLSSRGNVTFAGDRQREFVCTAETDIDINTLGENTRCGLTAYMNESSHYDLIVEKAPEGCTVKGIVTIGWAELKMGEIDVKGDTVSLKISAEAQSYRLQALNSQGEWQVLAAMESKYISTEVCEGFTGVIIGIFCEDSGENIKPVKFTLK